MPHFYSEFPALCSLKILFSCKFKFKFKWLIAHGSLFWLHVSVLLNIHALLYLTHLCRSACLVCMQLQQCLDKCHASYYLDRQVGSVLSSNQCCSSSLISRRNKVTDVPPIYHATNRNSYTLPWYVLVGFCYS